MPSAHRPGTAGPYRRQVWVMLGQAPGQLGQAPGQLVHDQEVALAGPRQGHEPVDRGNAWYTKTSVALSMNLERVVDFFLLKLR